MCNKTLKSLLLQAKLLLTEANIESPKLNADYLAAYVLNIEKHKLLFYLQKHIDKNKEKLFFNLISKRCTNEPLQYLLKSWAFLDIELSLNSSVLIPRPETEELVLQTIKIINNNFKRKPFIFADIGTGSGAIGISIAKSFANSKGICTDISLKAINTAKYNAKLNNLSNLYFSNQNLLQAFKQKSIDLIISNPPYIAKKELNGLQPEVKNYEPKTALIGGEQGTEIIFNLILQSCSILKNDGFLAIEHGHGQRKTIERFAANNTDLTHIYSGNDLAGKERIIIWKK